MEDLRMDKTVPDAEIVELYLGRDERAIRLTEIKYSKQLFRIAYNVLNDKCDSDECVNDTYLGAWNSIPPQIPKSLFAYLSKLVRNFAISLYRKKTSQKRGRSEFDVSLSEIEDVLSDSSNLEREAQSEVLAKIINAFLADLEKEDRFVFVSRYYFSYSVSEIAQRAGESDTKVYKKLASLREKLKKRIEKEGFAI
jgi:RNA polymerase sigma-70 factor (ECF subfamily)